MCRKKYRTIRWRTDARHRRDKTLAVVRRKRSRLFNLLALPVGQIGQGRLVAGFDTIEDFAADGHNPAGLPVEVFRVIFGLEVQGFDEIAEFGFHGVALLLWLRGRWKSQV
ncbi:MAG: hypothetical protein KKG09_07980 [Verrucomicrobia bacterium]|nr:hypothetical protein [Verrucomicrobiota bacterium]MBU4290181.1 hypothetical protein [Verrucomicrobiota bacterium]MBU4427776.1 hypothetical protein [Verrucomicrobiota bacterium]MBU4497927.1 hypothetical protein [Verrucomicrobiota bacterium]MCG2681693.1 hypothetical protein [Kiritimatiellia bacterium]